MTPPSDTMPTSPSGNSDTAANSSPAPNWNIANQVTAARLVASVILFVTLHFAGAQDSKALYVISLILFLLAAATDWIDGYLARSRNLVTQLGRILDPFADKIIICGTFVFLSAITGSGVPAWLTVIVVCRELMVTVLRSFLEQHGKDFSAKTPGKLKMVFQCALAVASLLLLAQSAGGNSAASWLVTTVNWLGWLTVISTVYSGGLYLPAAARELRDI